MYAYKNDCLSASIQYDKDFYNDRELKPQENLLFKLTIIPFAETSTPNLKQ
jgi:LPS-assembly protein